MKANQDIPAGLVDNAGDFTDPFFARFQLREAAAPLQLSETVSKRYRFPTLYGDVTCAIGIFLCDHAAALARMPEPRLRPVPMPRGRSLVVLSCYQYKNVMNVPPYNEISMMIPVRVGPLVDVPVLPMLAPALFPSFGYYVFHMPVTSRENQVRGNRIWGLPKVTRDIDISEEGGECVTVAREADGAPWFELRVPTAGKATPFDVSARLYSMLDGRLQSSRTSFKATFNVVKHMKPLFSRGAKPDHPCLRLGPGPTAALLRDLGIEEHPFQFRYARHMSAAFDLPAAI